MPDNITALTIDDGVAFSDVDLSRLEREDDTIEVVVRNNADAALEALDERDDIDCVFVDYRMDEQDGLEFFNQVRDVDVNVPFILATAPEDAEIETIAVNLGVTDFVRKDGLPDSYPVIVNRIRNAAISQLSKATTDDLDTIVSKIVEDAADGVCIYDDEAILHVNDELTATAGADRHQQLIGDSPGDVLVDAPKVTEVDNDMSWQETDLIRVNGDRMQVYVSYTTLPYKNRKAVRSVVRTPVDGTH